MAAGRDLAELQRRRGIHAASLTVGLTLLWVLLSGQFGGWFLALGVISIACSVLIAVRMDVIDHEGAPIHISGGAVRYWLWLLWEIAKADWDVAKYVFRPLSSLSPTLFTVPTSQKSELGQAIYANSITLTPGTVTVEAVHEEFLVHALTQEGADGLAGSEMDHRVSRFEGKA